MSVMLLVRQGASKRVTLRHVAARCVTRSKDIRPHIEQSERMFIWHLGQAISQLMLSSSNPGTSRPLPNLTNVALCTQAENCWSLDHCIYSALFNTAFENVIFCNTCTIFNLVNATAHIFISKWNLPSHSAPSRTPWFEPIPFSFRIPPWVTEANGDVHPMLYVV